MAITVGIDVSWANGQIDWEKVKPHIDFCMIRAGYGSKTVDSKFKENAGACTALKIPFGVYWFSYALNESMAKKEAKKCLATVKPYKLSCPIAFDFEYDSLDYAKKQGVTISADKMCSIACAFLDTIIAAGYPVLLYTNQDFWYNRGFKKLGTRYPIWCASWKSEKPAVFCSMWQDSSTARVEGINGNVDSDLSYTEYHLAPDADAVSTKIREVIDGFGEIYKGIAVDIIEGEYGNGDERVAKLLAEHRDPEFAQDMVNAILKNG